MSLQHGDKLFVFYDDDKIPNSGRFSYFGNDFGATDGFYSYKYGYILAVNALYDYYISCSSYRNDILDTVIYPLCFNYRHIAELNIKYLYFKYSQTDNSDKENFVKRVSHKLFKAWLDVKPILLPLLYKMNSTTDITLFDEFIKQIDDFDSDSFRMRYPIKKDLTSVHDSSVKLDVIGLHRKMTDLFKLFENLDNELDRVILNNNCDSDFINKITQIYIKYRDKIISISNALSSLADKEKTAAEKTRGLSLADCIQSDDFINPHDKDFESSVIGLAHENAAILGLLLQVGRTVNDGVFRLAINKDERKKDFFKAMELMLQECKHFISFDEAFTNEEMCYAVFEKSYMTTSKWLNTSVAVMEECLND